MHKARMLSHMLWLQAVHPESGKRSKNLRMSFSSIQKYVESCHIYYDLLVM